MLVADIMTANPISIRSDAPVSEAAILMSRHRLSGLPVIDADERLVGMITEEDLIMRNANLHLPTFLTVLDTLVPFRRHDFDEQVRHMLATRAGEVMSERLFSIAPDADVSDAASLMAEEHVSPIAVMDGSSLVGIICRADIVRLMAQEESGPQRDDGSRA